MIFRLLLVSAVLMTFTPATLGGATTRAELDCLIEPYVVVNVSSPLEGLVETVAVDRGALVQKGQVLATLEASLEKATVAVARFRAETEVPIKASQARLAYAARRHSRSESQFKEGTLAFQEMDEVVAEKLLAEMALLEAEENQRLARLELQRAMAGLGLRTIRSPITGVVVKRFLSPGEFAGEAPLLRLAQLDPLRVEVFVPVSLLGQISVGMSAQVLPEAPIRGAYAARVAVVDRVVDAASGTFGVRLELPNPGNRIPAGLKCKVRFQR